MPARFKTLKYDHPSFLEISGHVLTIWIAVSLFVGFAFAMRKWHAKTAKLWELVKNKMIFNNAIRMMLESWIYFQLAFMLNLKYGVNQSPTSIVNTIISIVVSVALVIFGKFLFDKVWTNRRNLDESSFKTKFGELVKELNLKNRPEFLLNAFYFYIRRFLLALIIVFTGELPAVQLFFVTLVHVAHMAYTIKARPFTRKLINCVEIYIEIVVVLVTLSFSLYLMTVNYDTEIAILMILMCISAVLASMLVIVVGLINKIKQMRKRDKVKNDDEQPDMTIVTEEAWKDEENSMFKKDTTICGSSNMPSFEQQSYHDTSKNVAKRHKKGNTINLIQVSNDDSEKGFTVRDTEIKPPFTVREGGTKKKTRKRDKVLNLV